MAVTLEATERPGYEEDYHAWALDQARRLREIAAARPNEPIDWELLAEEVEDLGKSERHACESFVEQIIAHLLKLEYSTAIEPRGGWEDEIAAARVNLRRRTTPTIRRHLQQSRNELYRDAVEILRGSFERHEPDALARIPDACPYSFEQITDAWWPEPQQP